MNEYDTVVKIHAERLDVAEHLQVIEAKAFKTFQDSIIRIDKELRQVTSACRQLGSSVRVVVSSKRLCRRLSKILYLVHTNAIHLFPSKIARRAGQEFYDRVQPTTTSLNNARPKGLFRGNRFKRYKARMRWEVQVVPDTQDRSKLNGEDLQKLEFKQFPSQLQKLAEDLREFTYSLDEFRDFHDLSPNAPIIRLAEDLMYRISYLKEYEGLLQELQIRQYIHGLITRLAAPHIDGISKSLANFRKRAVPTIKATQMHEADKMLNVLTAATFFSAVTATTLQISSGQNSNVLQNAVNGFWFTSLVFSIGAALNSLLGLTWMQAMNRSPVRQIPPSVLTWIRKSPFSFLVLSVATFSIGLVLFAYSSSQHIVTAIVTTVTSACTCFALGILSVYLALGRGSIAREVAGLGFMFPMKSLSSLYGRLFDLNHRRSDEIPVINADSIGMRNSMDVDAELNAGSVPGNSTRHYTDSLQRMTSAIPVVNQVSMAPVHGSHSERHSSELRLSRIPLNTTEHDDEVIDLSRQWSIVSRNPGGNPLRLNVLPSIPASSPNSPITPITISPAATRDPQKRYLIVAPTPLRQSSTNSRLTTLVGQIKQMKTTSELTLVDPHNEAMRHLQFSPNGHLLATSSRDKTTITNCINATLSPEDCQVLPRSESVEQIAWSPNGAFVLTKYQTSIGIWTVEGICKQVVSRRETITTVAWLSGSEAFLCVGENAISKLNVSNGRITGAYELAKHGSRGKLIVRDIALDNNNEHIFCVSTIIPNNNNPWREGQLLGIDTVFPQNRTDFAPLVFNLCHGKVETCIPLLFDPHHISISRDNLSILISYEAAPPQLWSLQSLADGFQSLSLKHINTYDNNAPSVGPSYFGGELDQLIVGVVKGGEICIWGRDSGEHLHSISARESAGETFCIACNRGSAQVMVATGSQDGTVRIWKAPPDPSPNNPFTHHEPARGRPGFDARSSAVHSSSRSRRRTSSISDHSTLARSPSPRR